MIFPQQGRVLYKGEANAGPSPRIWGEPEIARACSDPAFGYHFWDDFTTFPLWAGTTQAGTGSYKAFSSTGGFVVDAGIAGGVLKLGADNADEGAALGGAAFPFRIQGCAAGAVNYGKKMAFEARVKASSVAVNQFDWFVGLMDTATLGAALPITATQGTLASEILVGFLANSTAAGRMDTMYANATTPAAIKASALAAAASTSNRGDTIPAFALDTWFNLGILYDPFQVNSNSDNMGLYVNGLLLNEGLTNAEIAALTSFAAAFLAPVIGATNVANDGVGITYIDWWKGAQLR